MEKLKIFCSHPCILGESPVWLSGRDSFLWLDILNKCLYEKQFGCTEKGYRKELKFEFTPTAIIPSRQSPDKVYLVADNGIYLLDLTCDSTCLVLDLELLTTHRTNDGSIAPDGTLYFGTMQWEPNGRNGRLYSLKGNKQLQELNHKVGIPNTFVWIDSSHVAISDSFEQQVSIYKAEKGTLEYVELLYDFSSYGGEPDGGVLDQNGKIWIALWGMGQIVCLDPVKKKILKHIELPVSQPSSCCFGGPEMDYLFITSAATGDTSSKSGQCFLRKMETSGMKTNGFSLCR